MEPLGQAGVSVDTPGQADLTQLVRQAGLAHVDLPGPQGLDEHVAEDALVPVPWRQVEQDHVSGAGILEHSVLTDPLLTELPDLLFRLGPGGEGLVVRAAVGRVQVQFVQLQGRVSSVKWLIRENGGNV